MKISTKGRYALRVMLDLAQNGGDGPVPLRDIAERSSISLKYLEQIISSLNRAGMLVSTRGSGGGYALARKPEDYRVGDILRAAEGSISPTSCTEENAQCDKKAECVTYKFWLGLDRAICDYVDSVTLADVICDGGDPGVTCNG